jgi:hypothetical protein
MVSRRALAVVLLNAAAVRAALRSATPTTTMFWTVTERLMPSESTEITDYLGSTETYTQVNWRTIKNDVVPTVSPSSMYTITPKYSDYVMVTEYYSTGAIADSDLVPESTGLYTATEASATPTITSIEFSMPVVMTAPASCPTAFTVSTTVEVTVPSAVWSMIKPVSTISATTSTGEYYAYDYQTWLLSASAAPFTSTDDFTYSYYIASCSTPPAHYTGSGRYGGNDNDYTSGGGRDWRDYEACYFGGCTSVMTWIIIIATILPGLFLLGFLESYLWFRRLMMGKSAMRFGTICWVLLSLWILCFTRMQDARSAEDQKLLTENWRATPMGQALKLWLRWGFKHRYPVPLLGQFSKQTVGIVPEGQPLHPALPQGAAPAQMGQVYYYPSAQQPTGSYPVPSPEHAGYYGAPAAPAAAMSKAAPAMSTSPVSPLQSPQQAYHAPSSPPPTAQLPTPPQAPADASQTGGTQPPHAQ